MEGDLATLSTWFQQSNGVKVNLDKTERILIGTPSSVRKAANHRHSFDVITLDPADHIKFL